jgi:hypothetical protein
VSASVSGGIYRLATTKAAADMKDEDTSLGYFQGCVRGGREALTHFVRDWSGRGRERSQTFGVVLGALKRHERGVSGRRGKSVLASGAGLGRFAWETLQLGSFSLVFLLSDLTPFVCLVGIRYDAKRVFAFHGPCVQVLALPSNEVDQH